MNEKLDTGQKHILRLAARDADADGWTKVSETIWPFVAKVPSDLLELWPAENGNGGHCRITAAGKAILDYT